MSLSKCGKRRIAPTVLKTVSCGGRSRRGTVCSELGLGGVLEKTIELTAEKNNRFLLADAQIIGMGQMTLGGQGEGDGAAHVTVVNPFIMEHSLLSIVQRLATR